MAYNKLDEPSLGELAQRYGVPARSSNPMYKGTGTNIYRVGDNVNRNPEEALKGLRVMYAPAAPTAPATPAAPPIPATSAATEDPVAAANRFLTRMQSEDVTQFPVSQQQSPFSHPLSVLQRLYQWGYPSYGENW